MSPADLYRALMVMRSDLGLLNEIADRGSDPSNLDRDALLRRYRGLQEQIGLKDRDSETLLTDLKSVRRRFSGLEMLGFVAPVPAELLDLREGSMDGPEQEVFKRLRALRLEVPAEVASDLHGCVSSCLAGYRVRLQDAQEEIGRLRSELEGLRGTSASEEKS